MSSCSNLSLVRYTPPSPLPRKSSPTSTARFGWRYHAVMGMVDLSEVGTIDSRGFEFQPEPVSSHTTRPVDSLGTGRVGI
jgi:hypothetical protein